MKLGPKDNHSILFKTCDMMCKFKTFFICNYSKKKPHSQNNISAILARLYVFTFQSLFTRHANADLSYGSPEMPSIRLFYASQIINRQRKCLIINNNLIVPHRPPSQCCHRWLRCQD